MQQLERELGVCIVTEVLQVHYEKARDALRRRYHDLTPDVSALTLGNWQIILKKITLNL